MDAGRRHRRDGQRGKGREGEGWTDSAWIRGGDNDETVNAGRGMRERVGLTVYGCGEATSTR
eukprot:4267417-Pleurochrysis_carterae.AAC.1